jgi:hypothetical protein
MNLRILGVTLIFLLISPTIASTHATPTQNKPQSAVAKLICPLRPLPPSVGLSTKTAIDIANWRHDITANVSALRRQEAWILDNDGADTRKNRAKRFLETFLTSTRYRVQWAVQLELAKVDENPYQISALEAVARQTTLVRMVRNESLERWQEKLCQDKQKDVLLRH